MLPEIPASMLPELPDIPLPEMPELPGGRSVSDGFYLHQRMAETAGGLLTCAAH